MKIKLTMRRTTGTEVNLAVTADGTAQVADIAKSLYLADPTRNGIDDSANLTVRIIEAEGAGSSAIRALDPNSTLLESGLRPGSVIELAAISQQLSGRDRGPAAATVKILSGPDTGREFSLPFGSSSIGRDHDVDVRLSDPLVSKRHARINVGEIVEIVDTNSANGILVGGRLTARATLTSTDLLEIGDTSLCVIPLQRSTTAAASSPVVEFIRSPRVVPRYPGTKFPAPEPPKRAQSQRFPILAIIAPLIMGAVLFAITRQALSLVFIGLSPILMVGTYVDNRITNRRLTQAAVAQFDASIDATRALLGEAQNEERAVRLEEFPSVADTVGALHRLGSLMWTHRPEDTGFLTARLGLGTTPSRNTVTLPSSNETLPEHWAKIRELAHEFANIDGVPIDLDLRLAGTLGLAGPRDLLGGVARGIVFQMIGLHSPAELVVTAIVSPTTRPNWDWLEWLPHTGSPHSPIDGNHLADNPGAGLALLSSLEALVEQRTKEAATPRGGYDPADPPKRREPMIPAVIVLVEADTPVDRGRLTRLSERGADANVHIIWCTPVLEQLPSVCRTFLVLESGDGHATVGQVRIGERTSPVACESVDGTVALQIARSLTPVVDVGVPIDDDSDLPQSVSYVALAGPELAEQSDAIIDRWRENNSLTIRDGSAPVRRKKEGNLRALVGHAGTEQFYLDIRSQGPHALVGGTTGAGKSEFLQSWVLGMAAAHSPDRLTFLFVDYKGGAAFADCVDLPHTVGLVTDLSPHLVRRALTSLRAELRYREHLLNRKKAKDLASLEKTGDPETPPSLLIVVDEFAALVQEVPEFVDGVVDVAQRGRSLGLHLILATQRPAGVIKDNLRANTNLRIALRMADEEDSTDILGVPLAAHFDPSIPGRGAAKTGPGRIVAFQTGYAGGWTTGEPPRPRIDIEELNFGSGSTWDVPKTEIEQVGDPGPNDIARMVSAIRGAATGASVPPPRKPWLDELAAVYDFSKLPNPRTDERLLLGVVDSPASQSQPTVFYEPDRDGNMAIYGTGGSGKSGTLRSIAVAAAITARGGPTHVYGLDFGASGLRMLEELPHVGAIIAGDDDERVVRLLRTLRDIVDERSVRYAAIRAGSIVDYRRLAKAPDEARILLLVDGIGAFREAYEFAGSSPWFNVFAQIAADGRQVGVHIILTADRSNAVPTSISSTIQRRLVLRLASDDDYLLTGVPTDVLSATSPPGRGILEDTEVQIAVLGGSSNVAIQSREINQLAEAMRRQGVSAAAPIGKLAETIDLAPLSIAGGDRIAIGVDDEHLAPIGITPRGSFLIAGPPGSGRTTALVTLARSLRRSAPGIALIHISDRTTVLSRLAGWQTSAVGVEAVSELAQKLVAQYGTRAPAPGTVAILIEGITDFTGTLAENDLDALIRLAVRGDQFVAAEAETSTWSQAWTLAQPFKAGRAGLLLVPGDLDGDTLLGTSTGRIRRADFPPGRGFLIAQGRAQKLQIAEGES
jgi:S-DNA-T family DNA segregation ATPase FtsK/SpoIIIE